MTIMDFFLPRIFKKQPTSFVGYCLKVNSETTLSSVLPEAAVVAEQRQRTVQ